MPSNIEGNLVTQRHQITLLETRDFRLYHMVKTGSLYLTHMDLIRYRVARKKWSLWCIVVYYISLEGSADCTIVLV